MQLEREPAGVSDQLRGALEIRAQPVQQHLEYAAMHVSLPRDFVRALETRCGVDAARSSGSDHGCDRLDAALTAARSAEPHQPGEIDESCAEPQHAPRLCIGAGEY